jgi:FHS family L-fucose permease-like MFS transporter
MVFVFGAIFMTSIEGLYSLVGVSFCMSLMFPTIYGIALGNLTEEQSKIGSAGLVMAIVGSALLPKLQGLIIDIGGSGVKDTLILGVPEVNISFLLPLGCFFLYCMFWLWSFQKKIHLSFLQYESIFI